MLAGVRGLAREPLVHFVLAGAVLFVLHRALAEPSDPPTAEAVAGLLVPSDPIVVDAAVRQTLIEDWAKTHPDPPTDEQLEALVQAWIDEEVLYREGLERGLARDDPQVRTRIASQMAYVLQSRIAVPEPSDAELRAWFREHADRFAQPERIDFTQVYVEGDDPPAEARARDLLRLLEDGADPDGLGDVFSGGRRFRGRRLAELTERFGDAFTEGMAAQPVDTWALRRSPSGIHLVRVDRRTSGSAADFERVRDAVRHDWEQAQRADALSDAREVLREHWEITIEP